MAPEQCLSYKVGELAGKAGLRINEVSAKMYTPKDAVTGILVTGTLAVYLVALGLRISHGGVPVDSVADDPFAIPVLGGLAESTFGMFLANNKIDTCIPLSSTIGPAIASSLLKWADGLEPARQ